MVYHEKKNVKYELYQLTLKYAKLKRNTQTISEYEPLRLI